MRSLEEIERDLAALPPGPWTTEDHAVKTSSQDTPWTEVLDAEGSVVVDTSNSDHSVEEEDGKLHDTGAATCERIARLRGDAPDLVAEVRRLRRDLEEDEEVLAESVHLWDRLQSAANNVCGHCRKPFEDMPAHIRECEKSPLVAELRRLRSLIEMARAAIDGVIPDDQRVQVGAAFDAVLRGESP